jgi:microcystin-dependent protein
MALHKLKYDGTEVDVILDKASSLIPGMIIMWYGDINNIPLGWALCDGTKNTPDLRNRFVVGAGNAYSIGNTGGSANITLTIDQIPSHTHTIQAAGSHTHTYSGMSWAERNYDSGAYDKVVTSSISKSTGEAGSHTHTATSVGAGASHENRPPYYALAYIMKI